MKMIPMAMALLVNVPIAWAFAVDVGTLPEADFADTEVSTNIAISLSAEAPRRLRFSLELEASPSNNVEVAVGCDVDGDGCLSLDESALTVGYDCGEWFVRSMAKDSVVSSAVADSGTFRRTYDVRPRNVDPSWNVVKVTRRGLAASNESISVELVESGFAVRVL